MKTLIADIDHFPLNPRQGEYRNIPELCDSLLDHGLVQPLVLWTAKDGRLQVLQGNRRLAAAKELGWTEIETVTLAFEHDGQALAWLVNQQETTDEFNPLEKGYAAAQMLKRGVHMEDVCKALAREPEQVQLYLALNDLPASVQAAVNAHKMSLATVGLLKQVDKADMKDAVQMVLCGFGGDPCTTAQAKHILEEQFLKPKKWRADWEKLAKKLKATLSVDEHTYVMWEDQREYVMSEVGQPEDGYEWATTALRKQSLVDTVGTWGDAARYLGVTQYVVPAPSHANKYVVLINKSTVVDADESTGGRLFGKVREVKKTADGSLVERRKESAKGSDEGRDDEDMPPVVDEQEGDGVMEDGSGGVVDAASLAAARKVMVEVQAVLWRDKNLFRTVAVWKTVERYLVQVAEGSALMREFLAGRSMADAMAEDKRGPMHWVLLCGLCCALDAGDGAAVAAMREAVGMEG